MYLLIKLIKPLHSFNIKSISSFHKKEISIASRQFSHVPPISANHLIIPFRLKGYLFSNTMKDASRVEAWKSIFLIIHDKTSFDLFSLHSLQLLGKSNLCRFGRRCRLDWRWNNGQLEKEPDMKLCGLKAKSIVRAKWPLWRNRVRIMYCPRWVLLIWEL